MIFFFLNNPLRISCYFIFTIAFRLILIMQADTFEMKFEFVQISLILYGILSEILNEIYKIYRRFEIKSLSAG